MIEMKYTITGLERKSGGVLLTLTKYRPPPSTEELERARTEANLEEEINPITNISDLARAREFLNKIDFKKEPDSDEGKMVRKIMNAWKEEVPELFQIMTSFPGPFRPSPIMVASNIMHIRSPLELWITYQQYNELGKPSLMSTINMLMKLEPNP